MQKQQLIAKVCEDIKQYLQGDSGHDWWHMYRVAQLSLQIAKKEQADLTVVQLGAWLHDIADWKFHDGDESLGSELATKILKKYEVDQDIIDHVCDIIATISFKGAGVVTPMKTIEGKIVQDADRLDALGAIGIARTFVYGGFKNHPMHIPNSKVVMHQTKEAYMGSQGTVINHFYEKLLLLKDRMNTDVGRAIAEKRHRFMQRYLDEFYREWDGLDLIDSGYQDILQDQKM